MFERRAQVVTINAKYYILRLCKHFSHKVVAEWNDDAGKIDFGIGHCELRIDEDHLAIRCTAIDQFNLHEVVETIDSHFARFSYREECELTWFDESGAEEYTGDLVRGELVEP